MRGYGVSSSSYLALSREICADQDPSWEEMLAAGCVRVTVVAYVEMYREIGNHTFWHYVAILVIGLVAAMCQLVRYHRMEQNAAPGEGSGSQDQNQEDTATHEGTNAGSASVKAALSDEEDDIASDQDHGHERTAAHNRSASMETADGEMLTITQVSPPGPLIADEEDLLVGEESVLSARQDGAGTNVLSRSNDIEANVN